MKEFLKPNAFKVIFFVVVMGLIALTPNITNYIDYPVVASFKGLILSLYLVFKSLITQTPETIQELWIVNVISDFALLVAIYLIGCTLFKVGELTTRVQKK